MADNVTVSNTPLTDYTVASDDIAGAQYQYVKLVSSTLNSTTATGVAADPLRVDPTGTTIQPVSGAVTVTGSVTANAGTNLNTSLLALEAGGNLATIAAKDFATQTTLSALNTKVTACNTGAVVISSALPAGANNIGDVDILTVATSNGKTLTYVPVAQGAAGTTVLAAASPSNKHKILGCVLTLSLAGTLKFLDGSGDLTGAMDIAASGGFVLPTAVFPYQQTATNSALSITTTVGAAKGVVIILTEA